MKRGAHCAALLTAALLFSSWHPLKMSYTAARVDEGGRLEVSFRVFQDDLEAAFLANYGYACQIVAQSGQQEVKGFLSDYFDQVFDLYCGAEEVCLSYQRMQPEAQMGLVLYFSAPAPPIVGQSEWQVYNDILTFAFPQQVNMFAFKHNGALSFTSQFDANEKTATFNIR
ncbi:DUF6702 family protein [Phaeodactylibacter luteus]|uniref:Uncharacterized protein n=1 Tax=Phaeodactylibacter luteus TaxID=1564516 RepID=A0A5C6S1A5_9BACT|nr:DUF6702 family protein [Phaeodactylibacter luteus]TXB68301.1 hypothetical protein FRY97_02665 [Phaeodactylibacter luteus]